jgi:hypothetical protein
MAVITLGAGLALLVGRSSSSIAFATRRIVAVPGGFHVFAPGSRRMVIPGTPFVGTGIARVDFHPLALMVFFVGLVVLGLFAVWYWSRWSSRRRDSRPDGTRTPSWN